MALGASEATAPPTGALAVPGSTGGNQPGAAPAAVTAAGVALASAISSPVSWSRQTHG